MEWSDPCPARGAALSHAHWRDCNPTEGPHPGTAIVHMWDVCCHCNQRVGVPRREGTGLLSGSATPVEPGSLDHPYVPTLAGYCLRCRLPQIAHPATHSRAAAEKQEDEFGLDGPCPVKHESITSKLLIGDEGEVWTKCPHCGTILEPKVATGKVEGRRWGLGRGEFGQRDAQRAIGHVGWRAWLAEHGGGELPAD